MPFQNGLKFQSFVEFNQYITEDERVIVDYLRQLVLKILPESTKEKLTFNVPYFYGKRRICIIWPASVPCGGVRRGVLLGFAQGNRLTDPNNYLDHGVNKQIFYRIYQTPEEINETELISLLENAVEIDKKFK